MTTDKGRVRKLTSQEIGMAVRSIRSTAEMKQLTLAIEAGISERAVQRVEAGEGASNETLARIAQVFRMDRNAFTKSRYVMSNAEVALYADELKVIDAGRIESMQACDVFLNFHGMLPDKRHVTDDAAEAVVSFLDAVTDWSTAMSNPFGIGATTQMERLEACRSIFTELQKVRAAGFEIVYGKYRTDDAFDIIALTFVPMLDEARVQIRQLIVPRRVGNMLLSAVGQS